MEIERNDLPIKDAETYLGDGLYVSFDGWNINLRAQRVDGDHFVSLEPAMYRSLMEWFARYSVLWEYFTSGGRK